MQDCISCDHRVSQISQMFNCCVLCEVAFSEREGAIPQLCEPASMLETYSLFSHYQEKKMNLVSEDKEAQ